MNTQKPIITWLSRKFVRIFAVAMLAVLFGAAHLPSVSTQEKEELAARFAFEQMPFPEVSTGPKARVNEVHPSLHHISTWISAIGSTVSFNDLDEDGISNDMCSTDPRTKEIVVAPVPGTPERFKAFAIHLPGELFDTKYMAPTGCLLGDFNEDGLTDGFVRFFGRTPILFLRKTPAEGRSLAPSADDFVIREMVPGSKSLWYSSSATQTDLDGDGHNDIVLGNYFIDDSRMLDPNGTGKERMQDSMSAANNGGKNRLFIWTGGTAGAEPTATFRIDEQALTEHEARAWTLAVGAADLDKDGLSDLYISNDFGPDHLFLNRSQPGKVKLERIYGERGFFDPKSKVVGRDSFKGMGVDFADINGDGYFDMFVSNLAAKWALSESHFLWVSTGDVGAFQRGVAPYYDASEDLGVSRSDWGWDSRLIDFDNDGVMEAVQAVGFTKGEIDRWPELQEFGTGNDWFIGNTSMWPRLQPGDELSGRTPTPFYVRGSDGRFYDVPPRGGIREPHCTRGIATADVDGDGDLDVALANQWEPSYFFRNDSPSSGAFLGLHVLLPPAGASPRKLDSYLGHPRSQADGYPAIGAFATLNMPDGSVHIAQIDGGNGHGGAKAPELHFGLGHRTDRSELNVVLRWRDGQGRMHENKLQLQPGWHTVLLGD